MVFGRVSCRLGLILGSVFLSRCLSTESTLYKPTEDILCLVCPAVRLLVVMAAAFTAALQNALAASGGVPLHAAGDAAVIAASKGMKALTEERRRTRRIGG